jgi:hypothetical protein
MATDAGSTEGTASKEADTATPAAERMNLPKSLSIFMI